MSQFTPDTWARFGSGPHTNAYDPDQAMTAWGKYMTYLLNLFNWDYSKALTGYNGGEGHVLDPARYKPPSAAALRYAREILAEAGQEPQNNTQDTQEENQTNWLLIGTVVAIALVALGALDD
jgi:soluble lytic murein transglycosylase-like protein